MQSVPTAISDLFFNYEKNRAALTVPRKPKEGAPIYDDKILLDIADEFIDLLDSIYPFVALPAPADLVADFYRRM